MNYQTCGGHWQDVGLVVSWTEVWVAWETPKCSWPLKQGKSFWGLCLLTCGVSANSGCLVPESNCSIPAGVATEELVSGKSGISWNHWNYPNHWKTWFVGRKDERAGSKEALTPEWPWGLYPWYGAAVVLRSVTEGKWLMEFRDDGSKFWAVGSLDL